MYACVHLVLWTCKVLRGSAYPYIWIFIHTCITIISIQQEMPIRQGTTAILKKTNKKQHWDNPDIQILKHVLICFSLVLVLFAEYKEQENYFLADPRQVKEPFLVLGEVTKQTILKSAHTHTHIHKKKRKGESRLLLHPAGRTTTCYVKQTNLSHAIHLVLIDESVCDRIVGAFFLCFVWCMCTRA